MSHNALLLLSQGVPINVQWVLNQVTVEESPQQSGIVGLDLLVGKLDDVFEVIILLQYFSTEEQTKGCSMFLRVFF